MAHSIPALRQRLVDRRAIAWSGILLSLGVVAGLPWGVRERAAPTGRETERELPLQSIARLEAEQQDLKEQIASLRKQIADAQQRQLTARSAVTGLEGELRTQRILAGLTPLTGPGVTVIMSDSSTNAPAGTAANDYLVHDTDVRDIVNVLWSAAADAMAVNGERLVASSSIVCVGTVIIINNTRLSPPYQVTAIGDPARLSDAIDASPQLGPLRRRVRDLGLQVRTVPGTNLLVPAYRGSFVLPSGGRG